MTVRNAFRLSWQGVPDRALSVAAPRHDGNAPARNRRKSDQDSGGSSHEISAHLPGRPDQVRRVRHEVACYLAGCPAADDSVLIASELAANAIVHSASRGQFFTVRCQASPGHVRIEVEDLGGPWQPGPSGDRPHGLDIIAALTAAGDSGINGDQAGRTAWARLTWWPWAPRRLGISPDTAAPACQELARLGLIHLVPGHGYHAGDSA